MMKKTAILGLALLLALVTTTASFASDSLTAHLERNGIAFEADGSYRVLSLRVTGEGQVVEREFGPGQQAYFAPADFNLPDGSYNFEMVLGPDVEGLSRRVSRNAGTEAREAVVASGHFLLEGGSLVLPEDATEGPVAGDAAPPADGLVATRENTQVIAMDLIVQGSECVGIDCANSESFGFDTIRLKENNLRIKFEDTSNSGSFPTNDWQIVANDSANGGASYLAFQDDTNGGVPFRVDADAPTNSLRVESTGDVGVGTGNPVLELHVSDGDSPGLRLEQNASSGFTPQTWDVAGNETNFFVRDVTNGSKLPFKIRPNADTNSLVLESNGDVTMSGGNLGIGTTSPAQRLDLEVSGPARFQLSNTTAGTDWNIANDGAGDFGIALIGTGGNEFEIEQDGDIGNCGGPDHDFVISAGTSCTDTPRSWIDAGDTSFSTSSSRSYKENLEPVEVPEILEKIRGVRVYQYDYIGGPNDRLGLMAEDFHQIFGRGSDTELSGHEMQVAMWLAIQELEERDRNLAAKDAEIDALTSRLDALENLIREVASQR